MLLQRIKKQYCFSFCLIIIASIMITFSNLYCSILFMYQKYVFFTRSKFFYTKSYYSNSKYSHICKNSGWSNRFICTLNRLFCRKEGINLHQSIQFKWKKTLIPKKYWIGMSIIILKVKYQIIYHLWLFSISGLTKFSLNPECLN